jgi:uncharacterized protein involved in exopolysaccharide biosynthesis
MGANIEATPVGHTEPSAYEVLRVDVAVVLSRIRSRRWWIAAIVFATVAVATVLAFVWPKTYRAEALLWPVSNEEAEGGLASLAGQLPGLASLAGASLGLRGSNQEALTLMQSRGFLEEFIKENELLPILFAGRWDAKTKSWTTSPEPNLWDGYRKFRKSILSVKQDPVTKVVTLRVSWRDRQQASQWANALVDLLNQKMRARVAAEADQSLRFLDSELQSTNQLSIRDAIGSLAEAQLKTKMLASVRREYSFRPIDIARVPDEEDFSWPNRALFVGLGLLLGVFLSLAMAVLRPLRDEAATPDRRSSA